MFNLEKSCLYLERAKRYWNGRRASAGLLVRWLSFPIVIVNTYERSYESEGLAIGGQYGWVDDATRWQEECETYQRQPKQGGDDGYHQLHSRAVVSFHRIEVMNKISQNYQNYSLSRMKEILLNLE